jgi:4-amino-4-deoxy-L-arabinose transferase-like glycosyltransferase
MTGARTFYYGGAVSTGQEFALGAAGRVEARAAREARSCVRVIGLAALVFLLVSGRGMWAPDEPRFAQVAREMLQSSDWIVPRFMGEPLALLPPLTYWGSALASLPVGDVTEWTARVPIALAALLALVATMAAAGGAAAPWAGLVLLSSAKFLHQAQFLQADMLLVGAQTWALAAFWRAYRAPSSGTRWLVSGYLALAAGVLAKGPLGALLPAAIAGLFLLWQRDLAALRRLGLVWGVPLVLVCVVPWYTAACERAGEAFCRELLLKHNLGMFFDTWSHARPPHYYLVQLPWMFLPWTLVLPWALRGRSLDASTRFLVVWIAFAFLFFSASDAKQAKYLLPILPPLAILVGRWIARDRDARVLRAVAAVLALALLATAAAAPRLLAESLPAATPGVVGAALVAATCCVAAALRGRTRGTAAAWVAASVLAGAVVLRWSAIPAADAIKLPTELTRAANEVGAPVAVHGISYRQVGALVYYTGQALPILRTPSDLDAWLASPDLRLVFVQREDWTGRGVVLAESPYRDGTLLVANRERGPG